MVDPSDNGALAAAPLSAWRRLLHARGVVPGIATDHHVVTFTGVVPGIATDHHVVTFTTRDGVRLVASHLPGPTPGGPAVVLAHGFGAGRTKPAYAYLAERLGEHVAVLSLDMRGHGDSGGLCTLGDREALDVVAAAAWLRAAGYRWVGGIGASMGATALVRALGQSAPGSFDAVVTISAPAELVGGEVASKPVRRLAAVAGSGAGRLAARLALGVRLAPRWADPLDPLHALAGAPHVPLLVVHGTDDHYFSIDHAHRLVRAAHHGTLWEEPDGFGHAEDGIDPVFAGRLVAAVRSCADTGVWPARDVEEVV